MAECDGQSGAMLGLGLGLGIPFLLLVIVNLYCIYRMRKRILKNNNAFKLMQSLSWNERRRRRQDNDLQTRKTSKDSNQYITKREANLGDSLPPLPERMNDSDLPLPVKKKRTSSSEERDTRSRAEKRPYVGLHHTVGNERDRSLSAGRENQGYDTTDLPLPVRISNTKKTLKKFDEVDLASDPAVAKQPTSEELVKSSPDTARRPSQQDILNKPVPPPPHKSTQEVSHQSPFYSNSTPNLNTVGVKSNERFQGRLSVLDPAVGPSRTSGGFRAYQNSGVTTQPDYLDMASNDNTIPEHEDYLAMDIHNNSNVYDNI